MSGQRRIRPGLARLAWVVIALALGCGGPAACSRRQPAPPPPAGADSTAAVAPTLPDLPIDVMPELVEASIAYPDEARERGLQGVVQVRALVGVDGKVTEAAAMPGQTAAPVLVEAAVAAVRGWTFTPARRSAEPVAVWIVVPVNFRLH